MLKIAYQRGLEQALEEAGIAKEAIAWGAIGSKALSLGKSLLETGKRVGQTGMRAYDTASKVVPGGGDTLMFGGFGGGLGALTAEPGSRLEGFGKGLAGGLIGGAGWHYGTKGATNVMGRLAKSKMLDRRTPGLAGRMKKVMGVGSDANVKAGPQSFRGIWGNQGIGTLETAKQLGAKSLVAIPTFGAAMGVSGAAEDAAGKYIPGMQHGDMGGYQDVPKYVCIAKDVLRAPKLGLTPPGSSMGAYSGTSSGASAW